MDPIFQARVQETQKLIDSTPMLQSLISEKATLWRESKAMSFQTLIFNIQSLWERKNTLSEEEGKRLTLLLLEYRLRGYDIEYFTQGAGAPGNCCLM